MRLELGEFHPEFGIEGLFLLVIHCCYVSVWVEKSLLLWKNQLFCFVVEGGSRFNVEELSGALGAAEGLWKRVTLPGWAGGSSSLGCSDLILAACLLQCFYDKHRSRCCKHFKQQIVELFVGNSVC